MRFPKGRGFNLVNGLVVTVVLDDFVSLTGIFLGEIQEKDHHRKCDELNEFILIQLTYPVCVRQEKEIAEGTFCAINVDKIQFIFPGVKYSDKKHGKCDDQDDTYGDDKCEAVTDNAKYDEEKDHDQWNEDKW